jgi:guanylate kinase
LDGQGTIFVVSAPSGGGKGTILEALANAGVTLRYCVSATTRKPRACEKDGVDYRFVDRRQFEEWIMQDEFVEWAEVHGQLYGTLKQEMERQGASGQSVILELDVQGMRSVKERFDNVVSIFVAPPSMEVLEQRLRDRGGLDDAELNMRLANAREEIACRDEYDHVIVNDKIQNAVAEFKGIIGAV